MNSARNDVTTTSVDNGSLCIRASTQSRADGDAESARVRATRERIGERARMAAAEATGLRNRAQFTSVNI